MSESLSPQHLPMGLLPFHHRTEEFVRNTQYQKYQSWAVGNYGDSGKTKTVTRRKYNRIIHILTGGEPSTADNSKFRFWVKGKGFQLGPPVIDGEQRIIYVPTKTKVFSLTSIGNCDTNHRFTK